MGIFFYLCRHLYQILEYNVAPRGKEDLSVEILYFSLVKIGKERKGRENSSANILQNVP